MTTAERHGPTPADDLPVPDDDHGPVRRLGASPVVPLLLVVTVAVLLADVLLLLLAPDRGGWAALRDAFDVNREANVPTAWNAVLLVVVATLAVAAAHLTPERRRGWLVGAAVAAVLAVDEVAGAHERVRPLAARLVQGAAGAPDLVLPAALVLVGALALAQVWRWSAGLPAPARTLLRAGLVTYAAGAVVLDEVQPQLPVRAAPGSVAHVLARALEEGLEMVGCVLVVAAVLTTLGTLATVTGRRAVVARRRP